MQLRIQEAVDNFHCAMSSVIDVVAEVLVGKLARTVKKLEDCMVWSRTPCARTPGSWWVPLSRR
eukprot:2828550-Lingulodinium_polyedra.AAC.1